jgi:predicted RNase H-like HicB family nuclease
MLTEYIQAAMRHAHYEVMENGRYWGAVPLCSGCWADGDTLEECRGNLCGALESWIGAMVNHDASLPVFGGVALNPWEVQRDDLTAPSKEHPTMFKDGVALIIPSAECDEIDWPLTRRIIAQAGIDPQEWEELGDQ